MKILRWAILLCIATPVIAFSEGNYSDEKPKSFHYVAVHDGPSVTINSGDRVGAVVRNDKVSIINMEEESIYSVEPEFSCGMGSCTTPSDPMLPPGIAELSDGTALCQTWNSASWFGGSVSTPNCTASNEGKYYRNCNGLFKCKINELKHIIRRPAVGDTNYPGVKYSTDGKAAAAEPNSVVGTCLQYGLDYKNVAVPYPCWGGTNTGNFKVKGVSGTEHALPCSTAQARACGVAGA